MNSATMRKAAFSTVAIIACLVAMGTLGSSLPAAAWGATPGALELLPSPVVGPVATLPSTVDAPWSIERAAAITSASTPEREYRIAFLGGTGLAGVTAIGQGVWGANPTLTLPVAPYNDGFEPNTGSANPTAVTFRIIYTDTDGLAVDEPTAEANVCVFRDAGLTDPAPGQPFAMAKIPAGADITTGATYTATQNLASGYSYYCYFRFLNTVPDPLVRYPAGTAALGPVVVNAAPTLTVPNATPTTGTGDTDVTFSVVYTDDGTVAPTTSQVMLYYTNTGTPATPATVNMVLDTTAVPATLHDGVYTNGEAYTVTQTLTAGHDYYYRFNFSDGTNTVYNPTGTPYLGPVAISAVPTLTAQTNNAPNPDTAPAQITQPTIVTFSVTYTDLDGDTPTQARLYVHKNDPRVQAGSAYTDPWTTLSSPFNLTTSETPLDVTNGAIYRATVVLERPGAYYYYFSFTNNNTPAAETVISPPGAGPSAAPAPPNLYEGPVLITRDMQGIAPAAPYDDGADPNGGTGSTTQVTFRWRYKDLDEETPTRAQVYIFTNADLDPLHKYGTSPYTMTPIAGNPADANGALYSFTLGLPSPGNYFYYFVFDNTTYVEEAGNPPNATLAPINPLDPVRDVYWREPAATASPDYKQIMLVNQPSVLTDPALDYTAGGQSDADAVTPLNQPYTFKVTYTDADGNAPADGGPLLKVRRTTNPQQPTPPGWMTFVMGLDATAPPTLNDGIYTNGERYTKSVWGVNPTTPGADEILDGDHWYFFEASDSLQTTYLPANAPTGYFTGPNINDPPYPVTAGFDPATTAPLTVLDTATPDISWSPASDPNSTDTIATLKYRIEFSQTTGPFTPLVQYERTTTAGVTTGQPLIPLPSGTWYYRIVTIDDNVPQPPIPPLSTFSAEQSFIVNAPPELSDGSVAPASGLEANNFSFSVRYRDTDDNPPTSIDVLVNRTTAPALGPMAFPMIPKTPAAPVAGDWAVGVIYEAVLTGAQIRDGAHNFYFEANDGTVITPTRFPATGTIEGPTVNDPPLAVTSGFTPSGGAVVIMARPDISWDPATDPNSTDPPSSLRYRVEFSTWDGDWGSPAYAAYTVTTAAGVTTAQPAANLPDGVWYYRITTLDNQTPTAAESVPPAATQSFTVTTTGPYWLVATVEDDFNPSSGQVTTQTPTLTWPAGAHPTDAVATLRYQVEIYSDATYTTLEHTSPLLAAGVRTYAVPAGVLGGGTHYWRVQIRDRNGRFSPWTNQSAPGPGLVIDFLVNRAPELAGGQVTPATGPEAANFTFQVIYTDADNNAPTTINVFVTRTTAPAVGPTPFVMTPVGAGPYDYTAGVTYRAVPTGTQIRDGLHNFYFEASDGLAPAVTRFPTTGGIEGPSVNDAPNAVTSGFNPATTGPLTVVNVSRPNISWDAATDPNSTDVPSTLRYRVEFSTTGAAADWGSPMFAAYTVTTAAGVTTAQPAVILPDGDWYYRIITIDNELPTGAESPPSAVQHFQVTTGGPYWPVTTVEDDFAPANGARTTATPTLSWPQGLHPTDAPATLRYQVEIHSGTAYTAGTLVHASGWLTPGTRTYAVPAGVLTGGTYYQRVRIRDQAGRTSFWSSDLAPGPDLAIDFSYTPTLSNGSVAPAAAGTTDNYVFEATYTDAGNRPPDFVNVIVTNVTGGGPAVTQAMAPVGPGPYNYTLGVVFRTTISGSTLEDGDHTFYFQASDGTVTINLYAAAPTVQFDGPQVNDPPFAPDSGFDPTGGAVVDVLQPLISWDDGSDPNPTDTAATLRYRLELSQTATPFTVEAAYTAMTPAGVTSARPAAPLPATEQDWYYRVFTVDDDDAVSLAPSLVQLFHLNLNHAPAAPTPVGGYTPADDSTIRLLQPLLDWPNGVDPDPLDTPPTLRYDVQLDENMDFSSPLVDITTAAGVSQYQVTAADGLALAVPYYWRVRTRDAQDATSDWSTVELALTEPLEFNVLMTSTLVNGTLNPLYGDLTTIFNFRVDYYDPDDLPPGGNIQVNISSGTLLVNLVRDPTDTDAYTDGVTYIGSVVGNQLGYGHFNHIFQIAGTAVRLPAAPGIYDGPIIGAASAVRFTNAAWADATTYEENNPVYVEVNDPDENADPGTAETVQVTITEQHFGDSETLTLTESGPDTGLFRGTITTLGQSGASGNGVLNVQGGPTGDTITARYTDKDGGDTSQDTALVVDTVAPAGLAAGVLTATSGPSGTTVDLDWSGYNEAAQLDVAGYNIYYDTASFTDTTGMTAVGTVAAGTMTYTVTGLTANIRYWFAVAAFDSVPNERRNVNAVAKWTRDAAPPYLENQVPAPDAFNQARDTNITCDIVDDGVGVNKATFRLFVNGNRVDADAVLADKGPNRVGMTYDPPHNFGFNETVTVRVIAEDDGGQRMDVTYEFDTTADVQPPQVINKQFDAVNGWVSFDITDDISGVKTDTIVVTINGANVTADCAIDDLDKLNVGVRYDAPGGWPYNTPINISVDAADRAGNVMPTDSWQEQSPTDTAAPVIDQLNPANGEQDAARDTAISARVRDTGSGVNSDSITMTFDGQDVTGSLDLLKGDAQVIVTYQPPALLDWDTDYSVHLEASDDVGNAAVADWAFKTTPQPTFMISGMVTDSNGDPLPGVQVSAGGQSASSDGTGVYRLTGLVAGTYTARPTLAGYDFAPVSTQVTIGPSAQHVDFVGSERSYNVSGRVTRNGNGVQGVRVSAGGKTATTNANGDYTILDLANGAYQVTCQRDADNDGYQDFLYTPRSQTVTVAGANVSNVDFSATPVTYSVAGVVTDSSGNRVSGVTVSDGTRTAITNEAGRYTIAGVPASMVTVTPTRTGYAFNPVSRQATVPPDATDVDFTAYREFTHRYPAGRSIAALPLTPPPGSRGVVNIFGTTQVARWDASANPPAYVLGTGDPNHTELQARPGAAWFVNLAAARTIAVPGDPVQNVGSFSVALPAGWNLVGNMYETALPLANMNAAGDGQLRPFAYIYDNQLGGYRLISRDPALNSARNYLEAWEGAWFRAVGTGVSVIVTAPAGVAAADLAEGPAAQAKVSEGGWTIPIVAQVAGSCDLTTLAGVGTGAESSGYRVENPPKAPDTVDVYFPDSAGLRLAHDVRPLGTADMTWDFVVETDMANAGVQLTLPDLSAVPADQAVYLTDVDSGRRLYARTLPSYSFTAGENGAQRHFQLSVERMGSDNLVISSASVQATGGGAMVTYSVSRPCQVSIEVLNIAGRRVRALAQAHSAAAGSNIQAWDLRSDDGTLAPSGQYLVRIEAVADNGQRVQALRPLHVAR